jgi:hypothetical protein
MAYEGLYRGVGMSNIVGRNGMGTSDYDINNTMLERERQSVAEEEATLSENEAKVEHYERQKQALIKQEEAKVRAFNNANYGTKLQLQVNKFLDDTRYMSREERREAYDRFTQEVMMQGELAANIPGISDEERWDRTVTMQNALNNLALNTQHAMQQYDREQFITEKSDEIQQYINTAASTGYIDSDDNGADDNFERMMMQAEQLRTAMSPGQFRQMKMSAATGYVKNVSQRQVNEAIQKAAEEQRLVNVREVMGEVNNNITGSYFNWLQSEGGGRGDTFAELFKDEALMSIIPFQKELFEYNENYFGGDPESMIDISLYYNELYNLKK